MRLAIFLITATLAIAGEFTTSLGNTYPYMVSAIATDSAGNTYVVGSRALVGDIPVGIIVAVGSVPPITTSSFSFGSSDVFLSKLDPTGKLLFTDTFAGKGIDTGLAIALDPSGNIYIAGTTTSNDFPLTKALQTQPSTYGTGFIVKLTNDGTTILYSTYFGGTLGMTSIAALATDSKGNLYLTGTTTSADFPHTAGMPFTAITASSDTGIILASISAAGDKILYAGAIVAGPIPVSGGFTLSTSGVGVALDAAGNAYFAGNAGIQGIVAKVDSTGAFSYYGFYPLGFITAIAADPATGDLYTATYSYASQNSPIQVAIQKIEPQPGNPAWPNFLGGQATSVNSLAVDSAGNIWATGTAPSGTFPNAQGWSTGTEFVVGLNATTSKTIFSQLFPAGSVAQSIALDPSGLVHVAGVNGFVSAIAPTTAPAMKIFDFQNAFGGNVTARISPAEVIAIYGPGIGPATAASATPVNGFYPTTFNGVQVQINGANIPLLYVSANQINAVVPMGLTPDAPATVRVINGTTVSPDYPVWILSDAPQAFPTVVNQDGTINSQSNPAKARSIVTFYATGWQSSFAPLADGQVATVAQNICRPFTCFGAINFTVQYAGPAPGTVAGVTQFNIQVINAAGTSSGVSAVTINLTDPVPLMETVWVTP